MLILIYLLSNTIWEFLSEMIVSQFNAPICHVSFSSSPRDTVACCLLHFSSIININDLSVCPSMCLSIHLSKTYKLYTHLIYAIIFKKYR